MNKFNRPSKTHMFKKSVMMVTLVLGVVFLAGFASQMVALKGLPSAYDPGVSIEEAFKTAKVPLFIEFYSDTCTTCARMAPMVHDMMPRYDDRLMLVMLDIDDPKNAGIAQLFGVDELPGLFVFDFKKMKKFQITSDHFLTTQAIEKELDRILNTALPQAKSNRPATMPLPQ